MTRIVILGAGKSGIGAAILAKSKGFDTFVSDRGAIAQNAKDTLNKYNIDCEENQHTEELILNADKIVKSPGIPDNVPLIKKAVAKNIPLVSEIEFAYEYTNAKIIAITGSNGKTTTTTLIYDILKEAGLNVEIAGNIGESFAQKVAEKSPDYYVLELSSFQLDGIVNFRPDIAVLMNITPDHLNRYNDNFEEYIASKFRIIMNQTTEDYFIYNIDDEVINEYLSTHEYKAKKMAFSIKSDQNVVAFANDSHFTIFHNQNKMDMKTSELALKGKHNRYNSLAAGLTTRVMDIHKSVIRSCLIDFKSIEHRLEPVLKIRDVWYINDSKATNVNSTWYALESMSKPTVWIAGGTDKGNDYSILRELVRKKVKALVCLGIDNEKLFNAFSDIVPCFETRTMKDAVRKAYKLADKGDYVLLSPACASFDLFKNYEDRGIQFKNEIRKL